MKLFDNDGTLTTFFIGIVAGIVFATLLWWAAWASIGNNNFQTALIDKYVNDAIVKHQNIYIGESPGDVGMQATVTTSNQSFLFSSDELRNGYAVLSDNPRISTYVIMYHSIEAGETVVLSDRQIEQVSNKYGKGYQSYCTNDLPIKGTCLNGTNYITLNQLVHNIFGTMVLSHQ